MSREIRFRFWDTEEGKWLGKESSYWKELTFEDCRKKLIASMRQGNIVAEQYTGLKDKNGNRSDNRIENLELWVTMQPSGQRPEDLVKFAKEILNAYPEI